MVTLNKKDSERFVRRMIATEKRKPTKKEKKLAREIKQLGETLESTYAQDMKGGKEDMRNKKANTAMMIVGIVLVVIVLGVLILGLWAMGTYNGLVAKDTATQQLWGNVETAYQRRFDLIPNLVATVSGAANFEKGTLVEVTEARTKYLGATTVADKQAAANQFESALSRLLVTVEAYPQLTATANFQGLQDELAGTENRVKWERDKYNEGVRSYQMAVRKFPSNIIAGMFGFQADKWETFSSEEGADKAPEVEFNFTS